MVGLRPLRFLGFFAKEMGFFFFSFFFLAAKH